MSDRDTVPAELLVQWAERKSLLAARWPNLTGPFPGYKPASFESATLKVLYVGKATAGSLATSDLEHIYKYKATDFWYFARTLCAELNNHFNCTAEFAWSNVARLAVSVGDPNADLIEEQRDLAVETLRAECEMLGPTLVVFVTDGFADDIVYEVAGAIELNGQRVFDFETCQGEAKAFYSRRAMNGLPHMLWVQHPRGKTLTSRQIWIDEALKLLGNAS